MTDQLSEQMRDKIEGAFVKRFQRRKKIGRRASDAEFLTFLNSLTVEDEGKGTYRNCDVCPYLEGLPKPPKGSEVDWNDLYGNSS